MPADVDAPDTAAYGLTFRQLAILAVAALLAYTGWSALRAVLPVPLLAAGCGVVAVVAVVLALGRRDGLPMDQWLRAAIRHGRAPHALSTLEQAQPAPPWVQTLPRPRIPLPAPLRLPATAIDADGQIHLTAGLDAAIVAATTVNLALRTPDEQTALIEGWGRWLNSLAAPAQVVVTAQPVDLRSHARHLEDTADRLDDPVLADACADHAAFLHELADRRDPLRRQVLLVTPAPTSAGVSRVPRNRRSSRPSRSTTAPGAHDRVPGTRAARRRAEDTARALSGLGVTARVLDGDAATEALAASADPYRPPRARGIAAPDALTTGPPMRRTRSR
ncbi:PrgI family protein [Cryptosporangium phraense]|uniref:PrgI family protein n=1 Tax=Cryptosporangium phraense TaxID=2593070 RepID=A0A545ANH2_9ACTN|nr:PrgI family protein [Cryptosporangium phraense]TQS42823.1 PrgI family protein [Cryptosporangium phraense]